MQNSDRILDSGFCSRILNFFAKSAWIFAVRISAFPEFWILDSEVKIPAHGLGILHSGFCSRILDFFAESGWNSAIRILLADFVEFC